MTPQVYSTILLNQFESLNIPKKETEHRRKILDHALRESTPENIGTRYYNLAHEIKSLHFLSALGNVEPALDYLNTDGCDAELNNRYQIEFVCTSPGVDTAQTGYDRFSVRNMKGSLFCDYNEKEHFLFSRITTALQNKLTFYNEHVKKNTVSKDKPYLVFLGLGELAPDMLCGDYGIDLTGVLLGKGHPTITIDGNCTVIDRGYTHNESFPKHNQALIDCNLFCREEYRCISGVLFTEAHLYEDYTMENTWLFLNPFATVKIHEEDFPGMAYWSTIDGKHYSPWCNGKRL